MGLGEGGGVSAQWRWFAGKRGHAEDWIGQSTSMAAMDEEGEAWLVIITFTKRIKLSNWEHGDISFK